MTEQILQLIIIAFLLLLLLMLGVSMFMHDWMEIDKWRQERKKRKREEGNKDGQNNKGD